MKIALLCGEGISTNIVYNYLASKTNIGIVIIEEPVNKKAFIKNRIKKLGFLTVVGQILFSLLVIPILISTSKKRFQEICSDNLLDISEKFLLSDKCKRVSSVNSSETIQYLKEYAPDIVVVNGTRIISENVLSSCDARFINMHAGITPAYRGVHGGYWALYNDDIENCGVTVHFVDKGIDTGGILGQARISPTSQDNFTTYPVLQIAAGLELEYKAIKDIENNSFSIQENGLPSKLYTHPTIFQYLYRYFTKKIK
ncbi:MAG: formyl transferase [Oscillospiraceae bacterium]|nr:formyl transferase [Oscillospiraceae bacterium]